MDQAKRERTAAKSRFTRTVNHFTKKLGDDQVSDSLITSIFEDVRDVWKNVNEKHDAYVTSLTDEQVNTDQDELDTYIGSIQNRFYEVQEQFDLFCMKRKNIIILGNVTGARDMIYASFCDMRLKIKESIALKVKIEKLERDRDLLH